MKWTTVLHIIEFFMELLGFPLDDQLTRFLQETNYEFLKSSKFYLFTYNILSNPQGIPVFTSEIY